jgi:hypothetical protein
MNPQIQELIKRIEKLEETLESFKRSNGIPREIETAFRARLGDISDSLGTVATTAIGGTTAFDLPVVNGVIPMRINGKIYKLLVQN